MSAHCGRRRAGSWRSGGRAWRSPAEALVAALVDRGGSWRRSSSLTPAAQRRSSEFNPSTRLRTGDGGSSDRSVPSNGLEPLRRPLAGLGERSKAVGEALRTVARAWASDNAEVKDDRGRGRQRASRGLGGPRGPSSQTRAHKVRRIGFGGVRRLPSWPPAATDTMVPRARAWPHSSF
jgi:hypothetical protein